MIVGDAKNILAVATSLSRNLNGCGYVNNPACGGNCLVNSPSTDTLYTPNANAPYWDFRTQYEVWVDDAVFGASGFGSANISYVHASPAKSENDTITVTPGPCPPPCPPGSEAYITAEGASECKPVTTTTTTKPCPPGSEAYITAEGASECKPVTTTTTTKPCQPGSTEYITSEGAPNCVPIPVPR